MLEAEQFAGGEVLTGIAAPRFVFIQHQMKAFSHDVCQVLPLRASLLSCRRPDTKRMMSSFESFTHVSQHPRVSSRADFVRIKG